MRRLRRGLLHAAALLPWLGSGTIVAAAQPSAAALAEVERTRRRLDGLRALIGLWERADDAAKAFRRQAGETAESWRSTTEAQAASAVQLALAAGDVLRQTMGTRLQALAALVASARKSRNAVVQLANASRIDVAAREGDAAFAVRRVDERRFAELRATVAAAVREGNRTSLAAHGSLANTRSWFDESVAGGRRLVEGASQLRAALSAAQSATADARKAGWIDLLDAPVPQAPADATLRLLAPLLVEAHAPPLPADRTPLSPFAATDDALVDAAAAALRCDDAVTYVELVPQAPGAPERAERLVRQRTSQQALDAARERLRSDAAAVLSRLAPFTETLTALQRAIERLDPQIRVAAGEATHAAERTRAAIATLLSVLRKAERRAAADWEAAYIVAYGWPPPRESRVQETPSFGSAGSSAGSGQIEIPRPLVGHAFDYFDDWDAERGGYAAYSYVLLRGAGDLQQPDVHRRYERLLAVVTAETTDARRVSPQQALRLNLFCIPVRASRERPRPDLAYGSDLGDQLKLRMQCGLLTRPELRGRLTASPGPFLLTLPSRVAAATSSTPLLFADLAPYAEDAVADLARAYLGSLLADFPRRQQLWTPPIAQRVALSMIWLASESGALLQAVLPAATARPVR